jgi:hypothetical protein
MSERGQDDISTPPSAVRLTFNYQGDEVRLVNWQPMEMIAPPSDRLSEYEGEQGFWIEVRSDQEETLHRRVMQDPLRRDIEVFSSDLDRTLVRVPVEKPTGSFSVVVPDFEEADHVALLSSGAPSASTRGISPEMAARTPAGPAIEFARFSFRPDRERGGA